MKKIFTLTMILGFLLMGSLAFAWQDPCELQGYDFIISDSYVLMNFTDEAQFGPTPDCGGHVTILCPDDRECALPYEVWGEQIIIGKPSELQVWNMVFTLVADRLVPQSDATWEEVLARNGCPSLEPEPEPEPEALCAPDCLDSCTNRTACEKVGGHWYNEQCNEQEQIECPECLECPECPECDNATEPCAECPVCDNVTEPNVPFVPFVCPLVGQSYRFDTLDISYELSGFACEVGPGCRGTCDLWYGNFEAGPLYRYSLEFSCQKGDIFISGISCKLNNKGNLVCKIITQPEISTMLVFGQQE